VGLLDSSKDPQDVNIYMTGNESEDVKTRCQYVSTRHTGGQGAQCYAQVSSDALEK
jgi:hypothetical protein